MWYREYRDYPPDSPLKKEQLEPSHGMIGCEMHEPNGWGERYHIRTNKRKPGLFTLLLNSLFGKK